MMCMHEPAPGIRGRVPWTRLYAVGVLGCRSTVLAGGEVGEVVQGQALAHGGDGDYTFSFCPETIIGAWRSSARAAEQVMPPCISK